MKKIVIISVSIVCVVFIGLAFAKGPGGLWHPSPEEKIDFVKSRITQTLALDPAQQTLLDRIADEILAEHQQLKNQRATFKANFMDLLGEEQVSAEDLNALFETKKPVIESIMQLASGHIAEFHGALTPEQRATLITEIESHQGRRCRFGR